MTKRLKWEKNSGWTGKGCGVLVPTPYQFDTLADQFGIPSRTLMRFSAKAGARGEYAPAAEGEPPNPKNPDGRTYGPDDDALYEMGTAGADLYVPKDIDMAIAQQFSFACSKKVMEPENIQKGNEWLIGFLETNEVELPIDCDWVDNGAAPNSWWKRFFERHPHLSTGHCRSVEEARVSAHSEAAVRQWGDRVMCSGKEKAAQELKGWHGMTVSGIEQVLREQMPHIIVENGWEGDDAAIRRRAFEMCFNPALHGCFDQKGHAMGGAGQQMRMEVVGMKGFRKDCRDTPDGRWITVSPMVMADGLLAFIAFVVQGKIQIDYELEESAAASSSTPTSSAPGASSAAAAAATTGPATSSSSPDTSRFTMNPSTPASLDCDTEAHNPLHVDNPHDEKPPSLAEVMYGLDDTILATSKSGYSNTKIHLDQFKIGIARLKKTHPELFPMMLWMDNWSGHTDVFFHEFCLQQGIILCLFRSHATMWSCALDNGCFSVYEKTYNEQV
eukprot:COSAG06_NODE_3270_length_5587_cov_1.993988_6_plen_499_part_01